MEAVSLEVSFADENGRGGGGGSMILPPPVAASAAACGKICNRTIVCHHHSVVVMVVRTAKIFILRFRNGIIERFRVELRAVTC